MSQSSTSRRAFLTTAGASGAVALAGCLGGQLSGGEGPIKIGVATVLSGSLAILGQEIKRGYQFATHQLGGQILGRDIKLITRDTEFKPDVALQRVKELIESENVDAVIGVGSSAAGLSVIPYIKSEGKTPFIPAFVGANKAREDPQYCNPYTFFPWISMRQMSDPTVRFIGDTVADKAGASSAQLVFPDYTAGQSARSVFESGLSDLGLDVTRVTMVPLDTSDYAPYLTKIASDDAPIVAGWFQTGPPSIQFIKQAHNFGLQEKKTFCFNNDTLSPLVMAPVGADANGWYGTSVYKAQRDVQMNTDYKSWYTDNFSDLPPNTIAADGFNGLYSLAKGMEQAGSTNPDDVINGMEGLTWHSPFGDLTYRAADHQTKHNFFGFMVDATDKNPLTDYNALKDYPDVIPPAKCSV